MRTFLWGAFLFAAIGGSLEARESDESRAQVLRLLRSGVSPGTVRAYVEAHDLRFSSSADDLVALKQAGADEPLLRFLLARSAPAGRPVALDGGEVLYEAQGVRAFKTKDARGAEVLVITNLDENGLRLDNPPDIPDEEARATKPEAEEPPPPREIRPRRRAARVEPRFEDEEEWVEAPALPAPSSPGTRFSQNWPFYQFQPANVPGPNSPWSPIFSIVPYYDAWRPWPIPTYPVSIIGLPPAYPLPHRRCRF